MQVTPKGLLRVIDLYHFLGPAVQTVLSFSHTAHLHIKLDR